MYESVNAAKTFYLNSMPMTKHLKIFFGKVYDGWSP